MSKPAGLIRAREVSVVSGSAAKPVTVPLSPEELSTFDVDLTKMAGVFFKERDAFSLVLEDRDFYLYAAQIAKAQFNAAFGGIVPSPAEVGMQFIRPKTVLGTIHWFQNIATAGWNDVLGSAGSPIDLARTEATYGNPKDRVLLAFPKLGDYTIPKVTEIWIHIDPTDYPIWPIPLWLQTDVAVTSLPYGALIVKNGKFYVRGNVIAGNTQIALFPFGLTFCLGSYMIGAGQE
ncbi:MAG: hypothetical protein QXI11_00975 [Thermoproteota archaeon]